MTTTDMPNSPTAEDPATIERDIRRTQDEMSRTVDKLGDQLTMKNLFNALLDKADGNGVDANYLVDGARRNPIALGLIAAGAIWLVSDKNSKFPSMSSSGKGKSKGGNADEFELDGRDVHHKDYVSHMSSLEMREGEDPFAYQRRRDLHRATFLMCERKPEEDENGFRQRLDDLTDKFREKRHAWSDSVSQAGYASAQSAQQVGERSQRAARWAANRAQDSYDRNPLIGGILAAAVGAALGSTIPISRREQEMLGEMGAEARDMVNETKDQLSTKAVEKKDELLDQADQMLQPASGSQQGQQSELSPTGASGSSQPSEAASSESPFIISERSR